MGGNLIASIRTIVKGTNKRVMAHTMPLRPLCFIASLSVVALLLISDFGPPAACDDFSDLKSDGRVEVICTLLGGKSTANGTMLDIVDARGEGWKAYCPNGTCPSGLVFPCSVRVVGRTSMEAAKVIFVERLEPLYPSVQSR